MGQELIVPAGFDAPAPEFATLNAQADSLAIGIGQSYGVIGYKGKIWSLRYRGEKKVFIRPDDGTPAGYLDIIVLGQARNKSKSYFQKYDTNNPDGGDRPLCASMDGLTPDADVPAKQSQACAVCPRNAWRTDPQTGRRGRDCQDYKRLAVLVLPTQTKLILNGQGLMEPVFLRVPPASLNALAILGETMANRGFHYASYVTRVTFDPNKSWPEMVFTPLQKLGGKEAQVILDMIADPTVKRIIEGDAHTDLEDVTVMPQHAALAGAGPLPPAPMAAPQGQQTVIPPTPSVPPAPVQQAPLTITVPSAPAAPAASVLEVSAPPATSAGAPIPDGASITSTVIPVQPAPPQSSGVLDIASGGANGVIPLNGQPSTMMSGTASAAPPDAGVTEETDVDLDARIAAILATQK